MKKLFTILLLTFVTISAQSYSGGSGTSGDPYQIANKTDLKYLSEHSGEWSKHFKQTADITFTAADFQSGGDFYNGGAGFIPIGNLTTKFTGTYDGDYHTIDGLYINRSSTDYVGFFGYVHGLSISNFGLTNVDITGNSATGGLAGEIWTVTIENCYVTGNVKGNWEVGVLVGDNEAGTIESCFVTGHAEGNGILGGLVGGTFGNISNCYSKATVTRLSGSDSWSIGGFIGRRSVGVISNSYSTGWVKYGETIQENKGFVGYIEGINTSTAFSRCYWDTETSGSTSSTGQGTGKIEGKTTTQMKFQSTFTNWNFSTVWVIINGDGAYYPTLRNIQEINVTPTSQASNIVCNNVFATQMNISWSNGNGTKRVVFAKAANTGTTTPVDGTTYTANATFGSGTQIGSTGWYCVYNGSGTSLTVTNLTASTDYIFQVFEYNGGSGSELYLTATATNNPKVQATNNTAAPTPNYALDFDGTNDYVATNYTSQIQTLEFWFNTNDLSTSHSLFGQRFQASEQSGNWQMHWEDGTNKLRIYAYQPGGTSMVTSTAFETGRWYHIAVTSSGSKVTYYVNGVYDSEHNFGVVLGGASNTQPFTIGASGANGAYNYFNGTLDEVRIWNAIRTQTQIQENMCKKLSGSETGLVAYYQMTNGSGTTLSDNSSNSNNGTLTNMDDADWITSGAAIGDASIADYNSPSSVNLASTDGDDVTVGTITGSPSGVQIYRIDGAPIVTTPPGDMTELYTDHYFGVFIAGGTTPTYTLTYNYDGHSSVSDESSLELAYRANNAALSWIEGNATLNTTANTLTLTGQTGTEYILGAEIVSVPTTQATNLVFSNVYSTQMDISWTNGNGSNRAVFVKAANTGTASPADNNTYTPDAAFGSGDQIGSTGWYCVYNGSGSNVTVTNLTANTDYIFQVFEYNGSGGSELYNTTTASNNPKVQATSNTAVPVPYYNYALDFDGTNDYVAVPANASLNMGGSSFTLEMWVKCSESFDSDIMFIEYGTWQTGTYQLTAPNDNSLKVIFYGRTSNGAIYTVDWTDGKWHHIAGVFDNAANKLILYMDGVKLTEVTENETPDNVDRPLYLGARGGSSLWYNGEMDEIRVWNVARSQAEIQANMCKKLVGNETGLQAYYKMTNGSGSTLSDNSSNSNNGTLTNMDDADWITSGAAIGDASIADYSSPSSVNLASTDGDDVTVGTITGTPDGVQIYRVDGSPTVTTPPGDMSSLYLDHYFGVFIAGGTTPTYTLTYDYDGHPSVSSESGLDLAYRANNATLSWTEGNATLNTTANTLTLTGQTGTEYILGSIAVPATQASNIVFSQVYATQMELSWTNGDGSNRVVFAKAANTGTASPADNTTYTANAAFSSGTQIGTTGWYCIYNGSGSSVTVSNLTASTDYIFQVFEYNGGSGSEVYLTTTAANNPKVQATSNAAVPVPNYALDFDGTNDYVAVPSDASLNMGGSSFTLETWVKCSETFSTDVILIESGTWQAGTYQLTAPNDNSLKVIFYGRSSNGAIYTVDWTDGKWHHIAGVFDNVNNKLILYYDGVNVAEVAESNAPGLVTLPLYLGARGGSSLWYNGEMDEIRIWNVARTQAEIQANMCKKLSGSESGLQAYYQMTDGSGSTLSDNSSNSNNGTLQNMDNADWVTSGAAIGDASIADYNSPSSVNLASTDGDDVTVGTITGTPDGVQIYRVDAAPNVMTPPGSITQLATEHYFGVFIAGGTSPTYTLTYNYEGHPGISNESSLDLAHRANNAAASWTEGNATLDQGTNTLTLTGQTGTEYILGLESSNPLPVELTSFTAASTSIETGKSVVVLKWETATEVNNYGFEILRSAQNDSHSESDSEDEESKWTKLSFMEGAGNSNSPKEYSFVDEYVQNGKYSYKLKQIDIDGNFEYSDEIEIEINVLPTEFALYQNYPNPFNPTTTITFGLPESGEVRLEILDILGQRIEVLFNEQMPAGYKTVVYNGANLSSGVYFYWLVVKGNTKDFSSIKKFMLMK